MRRVGRAEYEFFVVQQVYQAGIALGEFHDQRNYALKDLLQAHFADHEPADLLEQAQLLLGTLETPLEVLGFGHDYIISRAPEGSAAGG